MVQIAVVLPTHNTGPQHNSAPLLVLLLIRLLPRFGCPPQGTRVQVVRQALIWRSSDLTLRSSGKPCRTRVPRTVCSPLPAASSGDSGD